MAEGMEKLAGLDPSFKIKAQNGGVGMEYQGCVGHAY